MADAGPASFESSPSRAGRSDGDTDARPRAWAEIDLAAIAANTARLIDVAGNAEVMAVVKADAYGHGLVPVARTVREAGADWLGVALIEEALTLRSVGDSGRILAWLPTPGDQFAACVRGDIDIGISAEWMLSEAAAAGAAIGHRARVHLKIDTGLGRSGATPADWSGFVRSAIAAARRGEVEVVGIWTHLAYADSPDHPTITAQLEAFDSAVTIAARLGLDVQYRHVANSAATLKTPESHFDLVRPGIAIYGISPGPEVGTPASLGLRPAMSLGAKLVLVKRLPAGHGVSYAHQYVTQRETNVGLVPLGYADGIARIASNRAPVLVAGKVRPVAGRVCMDQFVVDIGDDEARAGDEVMLFGSGARGEPTAHDWALACDTIAYEIVTTVGPRVKRIYRG
ncbi:MAG: alanine racemase [Actinobacteria bacterium]|nr:alanine racemase [Actinomycetota bacterium]